MFPVCIIDYLCEIISLIERKISHAFQNVAKPKIVALGKHMTRVAFEKVPFKTRKGLWVRLLCISNWALTEISILEVYIFSIFITFINFLIL